MTGYPVVIVCILLHSSSFHGLFMRKVYRNFCTFKMLEARSDQRIVSDNIFGLHKIAISALAGGSLVIRKANAIGQLSELQNYSMILQDICFSIPVANGTNIQRDCEALTALFINNCRILRAGARKLENGISYQNAVLGFGPDCYTVPRDFSPGISSFKQYGGHSTITLQESLEGDQYQNWGNGLRFIKVGADTIRLSKAVEKGAVISYAYGWVDIATPSGIPLQVIVGECRDPLMLASLQVSNMADSVDFFTRKLGMKTLLFPLARQKGSAFEPTPPKDSIFMGYGADTMGLLLVPFSKNKASPVLDVGNVLRGFKIVVDTSRVENLPPYVAEQCSSKMISENGVQREVLSPDGYRFTLQPYKEFALEASTA